MALHAYLSYRLRMATEPKFLLETESQELHLPPKLNSLMMQMLPVTPERPSTRVPLKVGRVN
jgi:hypothetical protein